MTLAWGGRVVSRNENDWTCSQGHTDRKLVGRKEEVSQVVRTSVDKDPDVGVHEA